MILMDVMKEIGDAVDQIGGLRIYRYPVPKVISPAAVVGYPEEGTFRSSYGRGIARMTIPLMIMVPRPTERTTLKRASLYLDGSGSSSIAEKMDSWTWNTCHSVTAGDWDIEVVQMAGIDQLMITINLDVIGAGKA